MFIIFDIEYEGKFMTLHGYVFLFNFVDPFSNVIWLNNAMKVFITFHIAREERCGLAPQFHEMLSYIL